MSPRGRALFDSYVKSQLNHPDLIGLSIGSHAIQLSFAASEQRIAIREVTEEVGPINAALARLRAR